MSRAQRYLPRDCDPPTVSKADADATPILMVALQSDKRSLLELSEIADLTVKEHDLIDLRPIVSLRDQRLDGKLLLQTTAVKGPPSSFLLVIRA